MMLAISEILDTAFASVIFQYHVYLFMCDWHASLQVFISNMLPRLMFFNKLNMITTVGTAKHQPHQRNMFSAGSYFSSCSDSFCNKCTRALQNTSEGLGVENPCSGQSRSKLVPRQCFLLPRNIFEGNQPIPRP
jgi:hypothetical protein